MTSRTTGTKPAHDPKAYQLMELLLGAGRSSIKAPRECTSPEGKHNWRAHLYFDGFEIELCRWCGWYRGQR